MFVTQFAHESSANHYLGMISAASRQGRTDAPSKAQSVERLMAFGRGVRLPDQAGKETPALGSNSSPVFSIECMITANLRARATAARLKPRRSFSASAQVRSVLVSDNLFRMAEAASYNSERTLASPRREM